MPAPHPPAIHCEIPSAFCDIVRATQGTPPTPLCAGAPCITDIEAIPPTQVGQGPELTWQLEIVMAAPPCGTPEAKRAPLCIRWKVDQANPRAIGYSGAVAFSVPAP